MLDIEFNKIENASQFLKCQQNWEKLETGKNMTVFQSYRWNQLLVEQWLSFTYNRLFSEIIIVEGRENGVVKIIAPLIIQKHSLGYKWLGRLRGIYFLGLESYSDYMNVIYDRIDESSFSQIILSIKEKYPTLPIYFNEVRESTEFCQWCIKQNPEVRKTVSIAVPLPAGVDQYHAMLSKNTKQNLRTALNRMHKADLEYEIQVLHKISDDKLIEELDRMHIARVEQKDARLKMRLLRYVSNYLRGRYLAAKDRKYSITKNSMKRIDESVIILSKLNGNIAGYMYGLKDRQEIRIMQNCFKDEYAFYSPMFRGAYDYIIETIRNDNSDITVVDFTRGDETYKYKLGGVERMLYHFTF